MGQSEQFAGDHQRRTANKPEILLAEDSPADVYLIREALREHGVDHQIHVVADGQRMLEMISKVESPVTIENLRLIILDLNLPLHDGIEILRQLRETQTLVHVPVVVLTSSDSPRDRLLARELGADCYLRKPSSLDQFLSLGAVFKSLLAPSKTMPGASS